MKLTWNGLKDKEAWAASGITLPSYDAESWNRLKEIFTNKNLQMVSFTITEKGYALKGADGDYLGYVKADIENGPEKGSVYMTDRETVNKSERMKVTICLNPLHTALCTYGCMLNYELFTDCMGDPQLLALANLIGLKEGMDVVESPKILSPEDFIKEVIEVRFPNPYLGDTTQRIAFGDPASLTDQLRPILSNVNIFGSNLYEAGIGELIEEMVRKMLAGPGAVRKLLVEYLG